MPMRQASPWRTTDVYGRENDALSLTMTDAILGMQ